MAKPYARDFDEHTCVMAFMEYKPKDCQFSLARGFGVEPYVLRTMLLRGAVAWRDNVLAGARIERRRGIDATQPNDPPRGIWIED